MTATGPFRQALEDAAAQGYVSQTRSPFASVRRQAAPAQRPAGASAPAMEV